MFLKTVKLKRMFRLSVVAIRQIRTIPKSIVIIKNQRNVPAMWIKRQLKYLKYKFLHLALWN